GYLPCPADGMAEIDDEEGTFGMEKRNGATCEEPGGNLGWHHDNTHGVWVGTVPVRELNLPFHNAFDGWGRRITYAVIDDYVDSGGANFNTSQELTLYEKFD